MNPEIVQLNMRVQTLEGTGRVMPFFEEDPDIVVCAAPNEPQKILCRVKLDQNGEYKEFDTRQIALVERC